MSLLCVLQVGCLRRVPVDDVMCHGPGCEADPCADGVGWSGSTSLTDYPKTGPVTGGGPIVDLDDGQKSPFGRLLDALAMLATNDRVLVRNNSNVTVQMTARISRYHTAWPTGRQIFAFGDQRIHLDASSLPAGEPPFYFEAAANEHWKGFEVTGSTSTNSGSIVFDTSTFITLEDFWVHHNPASTSSAIMIADGGDIVIQDCAIWHNGDGTTQNTDTGVGIGGNSGGRGGPNRVRIVRCYIANAPDSGIGFWGVNDSDVIDCAVVDAGLYWNGNPAGDGYGIMLGGNTSVVGGNRVSGSVVIGSNKCGVGWGGAGNTASRVSHVTAYGNDRVQHSCSISFGTLPAKLDHILSGGSAKTGGPVNGGQDCIDIPPVIDAWNCWSTPFQDDRAALCADPLYVDPANGSFGLKCGSPYIGTGLDGATLGASTIALELLRANWTRR